MNMYGNTKIIFHSLYPLVNTDGNILLVYIDGITLENKGIYIYIYVCMYMYMYVYVYVR